MRRWLAFGFASLFAVNTALAAEAHWIRITSSNFELCTTANERSARDTLRYFEQVRGFFTQAAGQAPARALAGASVVRIVAFNSAKEYEPYRPNDFAVAYYQSTPDHEYIVMSHAGADTFPTAIHEFTHLVVQHDKLKFPPWLNEGLAELYSTLKPLGDKILVGSLIPGRLQGLMHDKWVPLATILAAGPDSPYYNEKDKAGNLYNEGWALTHMLVLSPEYAPKFKEVMHSISGGAPSAAALEQIYGKPLRTIEADLLGYLRGERFQGFLVPAKLEKVGADLKAEPVNAFDAALLLAEVGDRPGRENATRLALDGVIAQNPNRPEPYVDLGYLEWRQKRAEEAREQFAKAFALGSRNARMLWDYGRIAENTDAAKSVQALAALVQLEPDRQDTRIELAAMQLRTHAAKEAVQTLEPVKSVTPEIAPRVLTLLAYANLEAGDRTKARTAADQWKKLSRDPEERERADQLLRYLDAPGSGGLVLTEASDSPPPVFRQETIRPEVVATAQRPVESARPSFTGRFAELQCAEQPRMVLETMVRETPDRKRVFLIDDPKKLLVNGKNGQTMDLMCGPQSPAEVRIEYDPAGADRPGIDGLVRGIDFKP